jgi:hypothetical protein
MNGLTLLVHEGLDRDPFAGDVFVFRGRAGTAAPKGIDVTLSLQAITISFNTPPVPGNPTQLRGSPINSPAFTMPASTITSRSPRAWRSCSRTARCRTSSVS